ncbi:hypothetical protein DL96DRAFT_1572303 [Flagelloscypha sp. PMI_526]|nr:hypothetical protein DL96DRAFT_1572303 [Flagelloscypha sp. PMI_526]
MDASIDELVDHDEIDLQIAKLQAQIRALALKRNSTSPSIRIPPELLQQIFLVHRQIVMLDCCREFSEERHRSERPTSTLYNPYVPWLAPSQVSTNWRAVALACGNLWNEFLFTSIPWTKEFMARSRDAPLHVVFPTAPSNFGEYQLMLKCLVLVCRQPERVESLDLIPINYNCRNKETQADLRTLGQLIRPEFFPSLRRVSLKTLPPWNIGEGPPPPDFASSFLQAISTNNTSGLVSLIIEGIPPSTWGTRYFPTLTNLSLHDCPSVSVPEIHHLVEALPHLTHLTVANCCTQAGTETPKTILASEQRITLPKLELLYLNLPLLALSAILKTLDFPLSAIHSFAPTSPYRIEPYNSGYTDSGDRSRGEAPFTADFQAFLPVISSRMHSRFQRRDLGMAKTMFANLSRDHFQLALGAHSSIEITKK